MQPFAVLKHRAYDSNYASSTGVYQVVRTGEETTRTRPPSHNIPCRPVTNNLSKTPRSRIMTGYSQEKGNDDSYISNTLQDITDTSSTSGRVVRVNCLKTIPKPNVSIGKETKTALKENTDPQHYYEILQQKESAEQ